MWSFNVLKNSKSQEWNKLNFKGKWGDRAW